MQFTKGSVFWREKNKIKNTYPYITKNMTCDTLVIGGGISGALTAYYLAKEGKKVILAEKNIIGYGMTSTAASLLSYSLGIDLNKLEKDLGKYSAKRMYELCLNAISDLESIDKELGRKSEFRRRDEIYFTNKLIQKSKILKEYETRKKTDFDVKFIEKNGSINFSAGILTKNGGADFDQYKFTTELLEYLNALDNVEIFENTEIIKITPFYEKVLCTTNNKFNIEAGKLIFASGIEALKYIKTNNVKLYKTFCIVTKQIPNLSKFDTSFVMKYAFNPTYYIRFTKDGRIIICGEDMELTPKMSDEKYFKNLSKEKYYKLNLYLNKLFSNFGDIEIDYSYSSTQARTNDFLPIIDEIENMPNCFCNLGYSGAEYSIIGAKILKDAVKGLYTKDMKMFRIKR